MQVKEAIKRLKDFSVNADCLETYTDTMELQEAAKTLVHHYTYTKSRRKKLSEILEAFIQLDKQKNDILLDIVHSLEKADAEGFQNNPLLEVKTAKPLTREINSWNPIKEKAKTLWQSAKRVAIPPLGAGDAEAHCNSCGHVVEKDALFCPRCGRALTDKALKIVLTRLKELEKLDENDIQ